MAPHSAVSDLAVPECTRTPLFQISPYLGRRVQGRVFRTILRGREVFASGQVTEPAIGQNLLLGPSPEPATDGAADTGTKTAARSAL